MSSTQKSAPKHRARATVKTTLAEHRAARERGQWALAGKTYPSAPGKHAAKAVA